VKNVPGAEKRAKRKQEIRQEKATGGLKMEFYRDAAK